MNGNNKNTLLDSCSLGTNKLECIDLLSTEELAYLESKTADVFYKKGEIICKQGAFASHIMIIREGLAKTYIEGTTDNLILQLFPPVNIIGLSSLIEGHSTYQYSAQVYMDSKMSLIEISVMNQLINLNHAFAAKIINTMAEQSIVSNGRFYCLTMKQNYGRLADVILCLANRIYKTQKFPLQLSRKEFAELCGMSIESISRIITKFKNDGLITIDNDYIEIVDYEKLHQVSLKG